MLLFQNIDKKFGSLQVLNKLDLEIKSGGIFAILGPNGSGKTTLIKCVLGMVNPDSGKIIFDGESVIGQSEYRGLINYMPQIANFPENLTVVELIGMVKNLRNRPADEEPLIHLFGLEPFLNKKLGNLSGGTKQKVNIVLAFMFDCDLIILDEPTTGLDPVALIGLKQLINTAKKAGKTILLTTHIISLVNEIADEIVFLLDGKIYFKGPIDELKIQTEQENLESAIASLLSPAHV